MKIVLDSNVIIAAFAARGLCNALFESCLENHEIILCDLILSEVAKNLKEKIRLPDDIIQQILVLLKSHSRLVIPDKVDVNACRDEKDLMVLGSAVAGKVQCIVTGDKDLLSIGEFQNIKIFDPRAFWSAMKNTAEG